MRKNLRILIVEDDSSLAMILRTLCASHGYSSTLCFDGVSAQQEFDKSTYDLILTDVMLPMMDGFELAKYIRSVDRDVPIIFISARTLQSDIIQGFEIGADDYITKPFNMEELILRIEAIQRRIKFDSKRHLVFKIGTYTLDIVKRRLTRSGFEYKLTTRELDLLTLLCENIGQVVERSIALKIVWKEDNYFSARNMDVYVGRLRNILNEDPNIVIENVHGVGYKLMVN